MNPYPTNVLRPFWYLFASGHHRTLAMIISILVSPSVFWSQNFYHPTSGFEEHVLGPGTYQYYDDGGPNGDYSLDINGSTMSFSPQEGYFIQWKFIEYEFELNAACVPDDCCDRLTSSWLPNCGDLFVNEDYCGSYIQPCCETSALCSGEGISFSFTSDFSVVKPGWHIIIYVQLKDPYHMICGTHQECSVVSNLDCSGEMGEEEFNCWAFGQCAGQIDYYPECDGDAYPGAERLYLIDLPETQDLYLSCECITDLFLVTIYSCEVAVCQKADNNGGQFYLPDVPAGEHFLIGEYDCGGDLCFCDLQFECADPGGLDCDDADPVECGDVFLDANTAAAGAQSNEDDYCDNLTNVWTGREKVYEFIAPYTGQVTINMTGLSADLDLFVLEGCDPTFCLDESLNLNTADESVMFDVVEGSHYIIIADGYAFAESTYTIQIICEGDLDCGGEEPIDCGDVILSSNTFTDGGFNSEIDYCQNGSFGWTGNERIYSYYADRSQLLTLTLSQLDDNLDLFLLDDCNGNECIAQSTLPGSSDEVISIEVQQGETYIFVIDGWDGAFSTYRLEVLCDPLRCTDCGNCFTYTIFDKGINSDVTCYPKYIDCGADQYPSTDHQFQWTVDGMVRSTKYSPTLSLENGKKSKVCQIVKYLNVEQYRCCWDITPASGCQKAPLAHVAVTGEWPFYDAVLDASKSDNGQKYFWDFGDGSMIQNGDTIPTIEHTYNAEGIKYCTYVQNEHGISTYCNEFAPGAFECTVGESPQFTYSLSGRNLTITGVNGSAANISSYRIDFGDSTAIAQGNTWSNRMHAFQKDSVYEVCIRFTVTRQEGFADCVTDGCVCFTVKVGCCQQTIDQCADIRPEFVGENGGLQYHFKYDSPGIQVLSWEVDGVTISNSIGNEVDYTFPAAGLYQVCCLYRDPVSACYIKCCKWIYIGNPFDPSSCAGILYSYHPENNSYRFELDRPAAEVEELLWTVDDPVYQTLGTSLQSNFLAVPSGPCKEYIISVRYFDKTCNCYRLCCLRVYLCTPSACASLINADLLGNGKTRFSTFQAYEQMQWYADGIFIGSGLSVDYTVPSAGASICLYYFDQASQCYRVCCRDILTATETILNLEAAEIVPNPASDHLNIYLSFISPASVGVELMSDLGIVVRRIPAEVTGSTIFNHRMDIGDLPAGVYFVRIRTSQGELIRRIIHL